MSKKDKQNIPDDGVDLSSVNKRLDALIRIALETHFDKNNKFNLTAAVKALNSCGLGPTEIANILGKKLTDVAPLLYTKTRKKENKINEKIETSTEAAKNG